MPRRTPRSTVGAARLRRGLLGAVSLASLLGGVSRAQGVGEAAGQLRRARPRPNVLLVVADDLGVDQVGAYAASFPGLVPPCTPHLDAFAATAVRFTNAWSSPVCSPTRAQILTGRRPRHTGIGRVAHWVIPKSFGLQPGIPTLPLALPGYSTAALGKWHLTDPFLGPTHPRDVAGFERYLGSLWNLDGPGCTGYDDWTKTDLGPASTLQYQVFTYATTDTTDDAIALMAGLPQPWFLYVAYHSSHTPYHCPVDDGFEPAGCGSTCDPAWCQHCSRSPSGPLAQAYGVIPAATRAMTEALDTKLGDLLAAVDPARTAVFFVGDNGTEATATLPPFRPLKVKGTVYQGGVHVPLLARLPGTVPGLNHELVSTADLFATVAELGGEPLPADPLRDSVSILPYLSTSAPPGGAAPRALLYTEYFSPNFRPDAAGNPPPGYVAECHRRALRNGRFKLIEDVEEAGVRLELYQLADAPPQDPAFGPDPFEYRNLLLERASWTPEIEVAYAELTAELAASYPPLPVPETPPLVARSAGLSDDGTVASPFCDEFRIRLRYEEAAGTTTSERAYFDFDVSGLPASAKLLEARLEVAILAGAGLPTTTVEVCRVPGRTSIFSCAELFHTLDTPLSYATEPDWTASGSTKSIPLSSDGLAALEASLAGGVFTLGLRLTAEAPGVGDAIELDPARPWVHRLRVIYTPL